MSNLSFNKQQIAPYIDILFFIVAVPIIFILIQSPLRWSDADIAYMALVLLYTCCCYFINSRKLAPRLLLKRKVLTYMGVILFACLLMFLLIEAFDGMTYEGNSPRRHMGYLKARARSTWFLFITMTMLSVIIGTLSEFYRESIRRQAIEIEKNKAELALYRAQINPHFLFNTLNVLYGFILSKSDDAESVFLKISDILKYMYTHAVQERVAVKHEAIYISHYIELQRYRLTNRTTLNYNCSERAASCMFMVAPMVLITFIENAFKYGVSPSRESTIDIYLDVTTEGMLIFESSNTIIKETLTPQKGIGIENCRMRLKQLYPHRHSLEIVEDDHRFEVKISIKLTSV